MLSKRIIPCLDVMNGIVVKGVQFKNHKSVGDFIELAKRYNAEGADELVFYDITASCDDRVIDKSWIKEIAKVIDIPFCVAGGIKTVEQARTILNYGADKISINSPALRNPKLITQLASVFGSQCVVVGIDSKFEEGDYFVYQYTGDPTKTKPTRYHTLDWAIKAQQLGAGEIVLNCMDKDGVRNGYDIAQLSKIREALTIPLIASGGAGNCEHFKEVFQKTNVEGALAASVFHKRIININKLKNYLQNEDIVVRA